MLRTTITLCFCLVGLLASGGLPAAEPERAEIDAVFSEYDSTRTPGCSMAVYRDGKIAYSRGYGMANLEYGIANGPQTVFRIGSTSKQFTAMAIALLAEQGKLSLDDDIRKFFPEMPDYGSSVTVRHLVHHTSGLRDYLGLASFADWGRHYSVDEALKLITRQKELNFEPGTEYLYSNSNYFLMAHIVEKVSGQTLHAWSDEHLFGPLAMKDSHFHDDHTHIVPNRADGYSDSRDGFRINMTILDMVGDGGVYTTVTDLLKWDNNFYENKLGNGGRKLIDLVYTPGSLNDGEAIDYAFGLSVGEHRGVREIQHGGAFVGYRAGLNRYPDQRLSVAVLCNYGETSPTRMARQVAELYLGEALDAVAEEESSPGEAKADAAAIAVSAEELNRATGEYWNLNDFRVRSIEQEDGLLYFVRAGRGRTKLAPLGDDRFRMVGVPVHVVVRFEQPSGSPKQMIVDVEGQDTVRFQAFNRVTPSAASLAEVAGEYSSDELDHRQLLKVVEGELAMVRRGGTDTFQPLAEGVFSSGRITMVLERDEKGAVSGFRLHAGRIRNLLYEKR
jgi:CubicO group peptidase (beta-lactamase class C family)